MQLLHKISNDPKMIDMMKSEKAVDSIIKMINAVKSFDDITD